MLGNLFAECKMVFFHRNKFICRVQEIYFDEVNLFLRSKFYNFTNKSSSIFLSMCTSPDSVLRGTVSLFYFSSSRGSRSPPARILASTKYATKRS